MTKRRMNDMVKPGAENIHDVGIVGAGPAGSSCAFCCARRGLDVVVIEKEKFPRPKTCGDAVSRRAQEQKMMIQYSVAAAADRP